MFKRTCKCDFFVFLYRLYRKIMFHEPLYITNDPLTSTWPLTPHSPWPLTPLCCVMRCEGLPVETACHALWSGVNVMYWETYLFSTITKQTGRINTMMRMMLMLMMNLLRMIFLRKMMMIMVIKRMMVMINHAKCVPCLLGHSSTS